MDPAMMLRPDLVAEAMLGHSLRNDQPLDRQRMRDQAANGSRGIAKRSGVDLRKLRRRNRAAREENPILDRFAGLGGPDHGPVLVAETAPALLVSLTHQKTVRISGASDPTTTSCPSLEQTTPG